MGQHPYIIKLCRIINMSTASLSYQTVQDYQHVNSSPISSNCAGLSSCLNSPIFKLCRIINMSTASLSYQNVQDYQHVYSSPILSNCTGLSTCLNPICVESIKQFYGDHLIYFIHSILL